jgi:2-iminobutanoate/2-iminopropanoate deaminase
MTKPLSISAPGTPAPVGPYSPAILWERLIFISGQGPIDPATGNPVRGDIGQQTSQVFKNIDTLLKAAGSSPSRVLKCTVYLADINDFLKMNEIYADYFSGQNYPARTTIQAAGLPLNIGVEIDVIAYRDS